jgi:hypothetical protein
MEKFILLATYTWDLIQAYWPALVALLGSGLGVSVFTELVKRKIISKRQVELAKKVPALILTVFSAVFTVAQYTITAGHDFPVFFGQHTAMVVGVAYTVYHFGGSSAYKSIAAAVTKWKAIADAYNADMTPAPAAAPPVVAPTEPESRESLLS